ncbi:hypothetical protein DFP72DRAFT_1091752 [Ephemerocybe angulata]|uniref:DUF6533 domain-containing protein n=1 Tax=Ephemerocybe angulata TaxID=980116 RepID=A0A8H6HF62_9AGAR|nr:hypothetical protein DFP72DRAFT_1091752 [Tulosesus angulatus]
MSLTPEEIAELTDDISIWFTQDLYHHLTTLAEEVSTILPQKWRTGKILFLLLRYLPICYIILAIFLECRIHMDLTPKVCRELYIANALAIGRVILFGAEVVILLCLHALLGARRRYLALCILIYMGLTITVIILAGRVDSEASRALLRSELDQELGYGCTWSGDRSSDAIKMVVIAGYMSLAKATSMAILMLSVFLVRYRNTTGTLLHVLRRDSGVQIVSLVALRLFAAVNSSFVELLGFYNIPDTIATE